MAAPAIDRRPAHLLQLEGMSAASITSLLDQAQQWLPVATGKAPRLNLLAGPPQKTIANLFFEDSTRTRCSFTLAARRLGADTLDLTAAGSSVSKGETIVDTALNIQAMGVDAFVVRCSAAGGPHMIAKAVRVPVINAGDGKHEHPTQALLDLLTLRQRLGKLKGLTVGIVGDILNSRVARSDIHGLTTMGARVVLCGPPTLTPSPAQETKRRKDIDSPPLGLPSYSVTHDLDKILPQVDAIIMLRVQFERAGDAPAIISGDYHQLYSLTAARAAMLPPHAIVMHPGPMNRGLEIDSEVADDTLDSTRDRSGEGRSAILQQVTNGVAIRMAALASLLAKS